MRKARTNRFVPRQSRSVRATSSTQLSMEPLEPRQMLTAYSIVDLGVDVTPVDINNTGMVVGSRTTDADGSSGFRYDRTAGVVDIPGTRAASAINDQGQIVGPTSNGGFVLSDGVFVDLGSDHTAAGINAAGLVAGSESKPNPYRPTPRPVDPAVNDVAASQWSTHDVARVYPRGTRQGIYADIYTLSDINDAGYAVGRKSRAGLVGSSSILTTPEFDSVTFLPIPAGGAANAINNRNEVVGATGSTSGSGAHPHAYTYNVNQDTFTDLGTLGAGISSYAYDINDRSQIVGTSWMVTQPTSAYDPAQYHGFVWRNGQMTDLNTQLAAGSGWLITSANAINERGDIAAVGMIDGQLHGVVLVVKSEAWTEPTAGATTRAIDGSTPVTRQMSEDSEMVLDAALVEWEIRKEPSHVLAAGEPDLTLGSWHSRSTGQTAEDPEHGRLSHLDALFSQFQL